MKLSKDDRARQKAATDRSMPRQRPPLALAVSTRRMTTDEQRQYTTTLDDFLTEWVRQHLESEGKTK